MRFRSIVTLLLIASPLLSYAAMYKYQDANGNWVYSQHPPADGEYSVIKAEKQPRSSNLSSEERKEKVTKARESVIGTPEDKKNQDKVAAETAKNEAKRNDICEQSKKALSSLQVYRRFKDKDGNITRLDDDERQKRIDSAKQNIKEFCK